MEECGIKRFIVLLLCSVQWEQSIWQNKTIAAWIFVRQNYWIAALPIRCVCHSVERAQIIHLQIYSTSLCKTHYLLLWILCAANRFSEAVRSTFSLTCVLSIRALDTEIGAKYVSIYFSETSMNLFLFRIECGVKKTFARFHKTHEMAKKEQQFL